MMSSACIQSNGGGESQAIVQMSASGPEESAAVAAIEDVPKTPPIAMKVPTPEKEKDSPNRAGSPIGDDACPICLGDISDRCVADSCFHGFCLICLKEWSKQKPVCPLCKQKFTKIMYDIKSETDYKEWKVPIPDPQQHNNVSVNLEHFREFLYGENRRFFGYHTTNFPGALALHRHFPRRGQNLNTIPDAIPSGPRERRPSRYNLRGSSMFRLSVYLNNVWVQPLADITGRYRQTGPELYREQPALTHRLAPWVNRELTALLPEPRIGIVLRETMQLIEQYPINSREFRRTMLPHLGSRTNHFIHEFYNFARSPYDMVGHDNAAQYIPRYGNVNDTDSSSSSDDSDAIVEVDSQGNPISSSDANLQPPAATATDVPVVRQETLTQEGSVVISSGSSSSSNSSTEDESTRLRINGLSTDTHNPEPPTRFMKRLIKRARTFLDTVNSGASTSSVQVGSGSGASSSGSSSRAALHADNLGTQVNGIPEQDANSDDSTGCMIVQEVNRIELLPEIINLSSEGNADSQDDEAISKRLQRRGKAKPNLRRNNFANRKPQDQEPDHTYCTADISSTGDGTTSNPSKSRNLKSRNMRRARISEERKRRTVNDSDYVPDDSQDESISLSSSDTASSSHSEWGPSSERNYKKRFQRKQKNRNGITNTRLNKKKDDLESQSESGCNSDSDSDMDSVSDKLSYQRYLQRLNRNRRQKEQNQEKDNTMHTKNLSSNLVLEELRVPPIPSSSHGIDSISEVLNSLTEGENSTRNITSTKAHKHSSRNKTDNPSKVKKSFSIQFNTSPNVKQEAGVLSGIDKEQILRRRILARQNLLKTSRETIHSDTPTNNMEQTVSLPGSSSEKFKKEKFPSESSQYSLGSRRKDHSSKIKKSASKETEYEKSSKSQRQDTSISSQVSENDQRNLVESQTNKKRSKKSSSKETEYEKPSKSQRQDTSISSQVSENDQRNLVESQTNKKRSRKSSKEKKKKKKKKDEKEKHKEREKSKRKEKKKKRVKTKKIRRIESSSEENNCASE